MAERYSFNMSLKQEEAKSHLNDTRLIVSAILTFKPPSRCACGGDEAGRSKVTPGACKHPKSVIKSKYLLKESAEIWRCHQTGAGCVFSQ